MKKSTRAARQTPALTLIDNSAESALKVINVPAQMFIWVLGATPTVVRTARNSLARFFGNHISGIHRLRAELTNTVPEHAEKWRLGFLASIAAEHVRQAEHHQGRPSSVPVARENVVRGNVGSAAIRCDGRDVRRLESDAIQGIFQPAGQLVRVEILIEEINARYALYYDLGAVLVLDDESHYGGGQYLSPSETQ